MDIFQETLTTGANGMVGSYVDFGIRTDHRSLDVTDLSMVRAVCREHKPKVIIHLAAATDLARCEREPDYAYRVNAVGTYHMALVAREIGAKLVYVSTSSVFDGTKKSPYLERDIPNPINTYGHSKYLAELAVQGMLEDYLIVRATWIFGGGPDNDKKFVGKILKQLNQPTINVVVHKRGSPTYGKDMMQGIKRLIVEEKRGVFHMPNLGSATRADIVREILSITRSSATIKETDESIFAVAYQTGENDSLASETTFFMRPWQDALCEYVETEWDEYVRNSAT